MRKTHVFKGFDGGALCAINICQNPMIMALTAPYGSSFHFSHFTFNTPLSHLVTFLLSTTSRICSSLMLTQLRPPPLMRFSAQNPCKLRNLLTFSPFKLFNNPQNVQKLTNILLFAIRFTFQPFHAKILVWNSFHKQ